MKWCLRRAGLAAVVVCALAGLSAPAAVAHGAFAASCEFDGVANTTGPVAWIGPPVAPSYGFAFNGDATCVVQDGNTTTTYGVTTPPVPIAIPAGIYTNIVCGHGSLASFQNGVVVANGTLGTGTLEAPVLVGGAGALVINNFTGGGQYAGHNGSGTGAIHVIPNALPNAASCGATFDIKGSFELH